MTVIVLTNVTKAVITVGASNYELDNIQQVEFESNDPYKKIPIPYGPLVTQQIVPSTVTLKVRCLNFQQLFTVLANNGLNSRALYSFSTMLRDDFTSLTVYVENADQSTGYFTFSSCHIETLGLAEPLTEKPKETAIVLQIHANSGGGYTGVA